MWRRKFVALVLLNPQQHSYPAVDAGTSLLLRSLVSNSAGTESIACNEDIKSSTRQVKERDGVQVLSCDVVWKDKH